MGLLALCPLAFTSLHGKEQHGDEARGGGEGDIMLVRAEKRAMLLFTSFAGLHVPITIVPESSLYGGCSPAEGSHVFP